LPAKELFLVKQPHYSSEVNPDEQVWAYLKSSFIKNRCFKNIKELKQMLPIFLESIRDNSELVASFFTHKDVGYYKLSS
jgi:transposase